MIEKAPGAAPQAPDDEPKFYVGSYVLETLTTGMYTEPRDCIREYVQNGLDAIDAARQAKLLAPHEGTVRVVLNPAYGGSITIRDDGLSIPSERAWETLTSIGASRKNPRRQAGFRGIGRLAGIAYCDRLDFVCKAPGENVATTVSYNCAAIRNALREGGSELEPVFKRAITLKEEPVPAGATNGHYTEVRLVDISQAPDELKDIGSIAEYLKSVAPIDFRDGWDAAALIKRRAEEVGFSIPTVKLLVGADEHNLDEQRKPYSNSTVAGKKASPIRKIVFFDGGTHTNTKWWGWYGEMPLYGIINDTGVLGIRIRVKNLQLDGSEIGARILQRHAPSYARFASWHLGEIYIEGESAIPNARRDGFEDSPGWRAIEGQITDALLPLVKDAYEASGKRSSKVFSKVNEDVSREIKEIEAALAESDKAPSPDRKVIGRNIRGALKRIENLNLDDYTDKQQRSLREATVNLRNLADQASVKIAPSKPKPQPEPEEDEVPYSEFLDVVFEVINPLLDTRTFNKVRKALIERFKDV
jgi:hypothetical protein